MRLVTFGLSLPLAFAISCSPTSKVKKRPILHPPEETAQHETTGEIEDAVVVETRKTAAAELGCPESELLVTCTKKDSHGGCLAIQAKGCGKTLEYSFGSD